MAEDTKSRGLITDLVTSEIQDRVGQVFKKETEDDKNEEDGMTWKEHFYNSTAVFAVATSLTAIFIESSMIVTIVGVLCSFLGGAAALQQAKISEIESLREIQNQLNEEVNFFRGEVKDLTAQNKRLEENTEKLKKTEYALSEITKQQGKSVDELVEQLEEMRQIQKDIKDNLNAQIIQNVISVVLDADKNSNETIDEQEMNSLVFRLKEGMKQFEGVTLHEANFRKVMLKNGCNVTATIEIVSNLLDDDPTNDENIIVVERENARPKSTRNLKPSK